MLCYHNVILLCVAYLLYLYAFFNALSLLAYVITSATISGTESCA